MGFINWLTGRGSYKARPVEGKIKRIHNKYEAKGTLIKVNPYPENDSINASVEFLESLHNVELEGLRDKNVSPITSFELWYDDNKIQFYFYIRGGKTVKRKVLKQLSAHYGNADVTEIEDPDSHFPKLRPNEFMAGGRFYLKNHFFEQIRHKGGVENIGEPFKAISNDMVTKAETRMVIQICFKPAKYGWTNSYFEDASAYAERLESQRYVSEWFGLRGRQVNPPGPVRSAAGNIKDQGGKPGFHVNVRMMAIGPTKKQTVRQCKSVGELFQQKYQEPPGQTLVPIPAPKRTVDNLFADMLRRDGNTMAHPTNSITRALEEQKNNRTGRPHRTMVMTIPELSGLVHLPNSDISNGSIDWSMTDTSGSLPADAMDFEEVLQKAKEGDLPPEIHSSKEQTFKKDMDKGEEDEKPEPEPETESEAGIEDDDSPVEEDEDFEVPDELYEGYDDEIEEDDEKKVEDTPPEPMSQPDQEEDEDGDSSIPDEVGNSSEEEDNDDGDFSEQRKEKKEDSDEVVDYSVEDPLEVALQY